MKENKISAEDAYVKAVSKKDFEPFVDEEEKKAQAARPVRIVTKAVEAGPQESRPQAPSAPPRAAPNGPQRPAQAAASKPPAAQPAKTPAGTPPLRKP